MTFRIMSGGGGNRTRAGREARQRIDRELHGVVLAAPSVPDKSWYDLRRQRTRPYGGLLFFIDRAVAVGVPREVLALIPRVIAWYIDDTCDRARPTPAPALSSVRGLGERRAA